MTAPWKDQQVAVLDVSKTFSNDGDVFINEDETVKRTADWKVSAKVSWQQLRVGTDANLCWLWHSTNAAWIN
jgi:hypothetical protein